MNSRLTATGWVDSFPGGRRTKGHVLRRGLGLALLAWLAGGCDWMPGKPQSQDRWKPDTANLDFPTLYQSQCGGCHSRDENPSAARRLTDPVYRALVPEETFRKVVTEGIPGTLMPGFTPEAGGLLTSEQIDLLVKSLLAGAENDRAGLTLPPYQAPPGDLNRGVEAYATFCAHCHGSDGKGGPNGGSVVDPNYLALVSDQGIRTTVIAGRPDLGMPDWRRYVPNRPMSDQEIADVVAWIVSHRSSGGTGP